MVVQIPGCISLVYCVGIKATLFELAGFGRLVRVCAGQRYEKLPALTLSISIYCQWAILDEQAKKRGPAWASL